MRWLKIVSVVLLVLVLAFVGLGLFVANKYGDIIRNVVIDQLDEVLQAEMKVASIDVSSIEKAPYLSLQFNEVALMEPHSYSDEPDTLLYFRKLYLQFNLWDIYQGDYQIKKIELTDGFVNMKMDERGEANFNFIKSDTSDSDTSFVLALEQIELNKVYYRYHDINKEIDVQTQVKQAQVTGNFQVDQLMLQVQGDFDQTYVSVSDVPYLNHYHLHIKSTLDIGGDDQVIRFSDGKIVLEDNIRLDLTGTVGDRLYAFQAAGKKIDVGELNRLLPEAWKKPVADYRYEGTLDLGLNLQGDVRSDLAPKIDIAYTIQDGWVRNVNSQAEISRLACQGTFTNGKKRTLRTMKIEVDTLYFNLPTGEVSGEFMLDDLHAQNLTADLHGTIHLEELHDFIKIENVEELKGKVEFGLSGQAELRGWIDGTNEPAYNPFKGRAWLENFSFKNKYLEQDIQNMSGVIQFDRSGIRFEEFEGEVAETHLSVNGYLQNLYPWLFQKTKNLRLILEVNAEEVEMERFLGARSQKSLEESSGPNVELQLTANVGKLTYQKFQANNLFMHIYMGERIFKANPVRFDGMDGQVKGRFAVHDLEKNRAEITAEGKLEGVDIQKLFYQFEDFGQTEIRSENLRGKANAHFRMVAMGDRKLHVEAKDVDAYAHIEIDGGELKNYATLQAISDYVRSNLALRAFIHENDLRKELNNVRFDRLENDVYIGDGQVFIPRMEIRSNILGLHVDGTHAFTNQIDYHLDFDLSELFIQKKEYNTEFGYVEDDGTGRFRLFLKIYGDASDPNIDVDKERKKAYKKERRQAQETDLLRSISNELGLGKSNSTEKKHKGFDFDIEWEEESQSTDSSRTTMPTDSVPKDSVKKKKKLFQSSDEETEYFEFEDDDEDDY